MPDPLENCPSLPHSRKGRLRSWPKGRTHGDSMPTTRLLCRPRSPSWRANFDGNLLRLLRPSRPRVQSARPDHLTAAPFPALDAARYPNGHDSSSQANQHSLDGSAGPVADSARGCHPTGQLCFGRGGPSRLDSTPSLDSDWSRQHPVPRDAGPAYCPFWAGLFLNEEPDSFLSEPTADNRRCEETLRQLEEPADAAGRSRRPPWNGGPVHHPGSGIRVSWRRRPSQESRHAPPAPTSAPRPTSPELRGLLPPLQSRPPSRRPSSPQTRPRRHPLRRWHDGIFFAQF